MKVLIGTQNPGKQKDFHRAITYICKDLGIDINVLFPQDLHISETIKESGKTFCENSSAKAHFYYKKSHISTISDDGGIMIPILNNEPGIMSKRWMGREASDKELIDFTLKKLSRFHSTEDRKVFFVTCLTYFDGQDVIQTEGKCQGHISRKPLQSLVTEGFPYRGLFKVRNGKYYDQLTESEHKRYNHRDKALRKLFKEIIDKNIE